MGQPTRWFMGMALMVFPMGGCDEPPPSTTTPPTTETDPPFVPPCGAAGDPTVELSLAGEPHGSLMTDDDLWTAIPPQGGAPYSPLTLRMRHLSDVREGTTVLMRAIDKDSGELLGETELYMGFACANVGDNTDWWVGSGEAHLRYAGFEVEELYDRNIELSVSVTNIFEDEALIVLDSRLIPRE